MEITPQCVVALTWTLKDTLNETLDVLDEPVEFLLGGSDLFEKIEEVLQGHKIGDEIDVQLEPEQAFGDFNDQLIFMESRKIFDPEVEEGWIFDGRGLPEGFSPDAPKDAVYVVTDVYPEHVILDGNHPLAGIAIRLHIKVEDVREATLEEVGKGSCGTGFFKIQTELMADDGDDDINYDDDRVIH